MKKLKLKIKGMHCESCAKMIQMELSEKVNLSKVDYLKGIAEIDFDERKISEQEIKKIIENLGYKLK